MLTKVTIDCKGWSYMKLFFENKTDYIVNDVRFYFPGLFYICNRNCLDDLEYIAEQIYCEYLEDAYFHGKVTNG